MHVCDCDHCLQLDHKGAENDLVNGYANAVQKANNPNIRWSRFITSCAHVYTVNDGWLYLMVVVYSGLLLWNNLCLMAAWLIWRSLFARIIFIWWSFLHFLMCKGLQVDFSLQCNLIVYWIIWSNGMLWNIAYKSHHSWMDVNIGMWLFAACVKYKVTAMFVLVQVWSFWFSRGM